MSWATAAVDLLVDAVAASATFQSLVGASTAAAAKARIVAYHTGAPGLDAVAEGQARAVTGATLSLSQPYAAIFLLGVRRDLAGIWAWDQRVDLLLRIAVERRQTGEAPDDWVARAVDTVEDVRTDIEASHTIPLLEWRELAAFSAEDAPQSELTIVDQTLTIGG